MLRAHVADCRWFWAWALLGCVAAVGFVSLGVLVLAPVSVTGSLMASRSGIRRSAFGLLSGVGVLLLYVAWVQRAGPGTTCWRTASASGRVRRACFVFVYGAPAERAGADVIESAV